ncbi:nucleoside-diphosphate sugar epimerase [Glaciecola punicea]|uniref:polysaccharide biosynthesis protein n=1 Tax=Glaciecola punicea TaxID=56804 RepID=UPI00087214FE|nr:nucleoside-diphosphate sugar epimerase/dehydratase [Glaciecola punicea]OFA32532.1 nucleoside-diphosphate sugar epimerase [Glaciecola punicea]
MIKNFKNTSANNSESKLSSNVIIKILNSPRKAKRLLTLTVDSAFVFLSFWLALFIRVDSILPLMNIQYWLILLAVLPTSILIFVRLGLYRAVLRYMSSKAVWAIVAGTLLSTVTLVLVAFFSTIDIHRTMPLIYAALILLSVGGSRLVVRALIAQFAGTNKKPVVVYGAGSAGRQLANALTTGPEYFVSAFIDDDVTKQRSIVQGIPVVGISSLRGLIVDGKVDKILLALPSASRSRRNQIISQLEHLSIKVQTMAGIKDMVEGVANADELVDVEIEDLLGRESVNPISQLMAQHITGKSVMVSGAGGSIGSELCRQILKYKPVKLVLFEQSEFCLYEIEKELSEYISKNRLQTKLIPIMGSVQHLNRVENVMKSFNVHTIYHAAAYKHVPLVEQNVVEGVRNNVFGTYHAALAAINANVETFVLISTDKAVRPTNTMGASKRMAELVLQALDKSQINNGTRFCMVRFGNVLGSSGSVVPLFRRQIREGGPITLTHEDITRYFMTIPEAAQLVIQAGAMGKGGDVFVLDMGDSVRIKDLAEKMVRLSGLDIKDENNPDGDIEITCTGLRPGEKLFEELLIGDNVLETFHERILMANEAMLTWDDLSVILDSLDKACHNFDHELIRQILLDAPTGFNPTDDICDLVWSQLKPEKEEEALAKKPKLNLIK